VLSTTSASEFLGDSVLNLAVSTLLYRRLQAQSEGDLSRVRANLVKEGTLHQLAKDLRLPRCCAWARAKHVRRQQRPSILADALEAVIGAVYLDAGLWPKRWCTACSRRGINPQMQAAAKDAKTALQEWLQGRKMQLPQYRVVGTAGAAHRQTFEVECAIAELALAQRGSGASRRAAEQAPLRPCWPH
jgi:ribonuclease-3